MLQTKNKQGFLKVCKSLAQMGWRWVKAQGKHQGALSSHVHGGLPARCHHPGLVAVVLMGPSSSCPVGNIRALGAVEDPNNSSPLNRRSALYSICGHIHIRRHHLQKGNMYSYTQKHSDCSENTDSSDLKFKT